MDAHTTTIVQLSDLHLDAARQKPGSDPVGHLETLLCRVDDIDPACVVITGDIVGESDEGLYEQAAALLGGRPVVWCPGNHDDADVMRSVLGRVADTVVDLEHLRIIAVDSTVVGRVGGGVDHDQIQWVDATIAESDKPVVIALHHPPNTFTHHALEQILLDGVSSAQLERVVRRWAHTIVAVLCGHLHQTMAMRWGGVLTVVAPSSAYALRRCGDGMQWSNGPGGMLVHHVVGDSVSTRVETTGSWMATAETVAALERGGGCDPSTRRDVVA